MQVGELKFSGDNSQPNSLEPVIWIAETQLTWDREMSLCHLLVWMNDVLRRKKHFHVTSYRVLRFVSREPLKLMLCFHTNPTVEQS